MPLAPTNVIGGAGLAARSVTGFPAGTHMESWGQSAAPWLGALQTAAGVGLTTASAASSAMGPWGIVAGTGLGAVCGTVMDGVDAYNTQNTVAELRQIRQT